MWFIQTRFFLNIQSEAKRSCFQSLFELETMLPNNEHIIDLKQLISFVHSFC